MDEPRYNIRAVERLTGIPAPTLRSWERRHGFPSPARTHSARRLYSDDEVRAIRWVRQQTEAGLSVAQAIEWVRAGRQSQTLAAERDPAARAAGDLATAIVDAVSRYDEEVVEGLFSRAFALHPADQVLTQVLTPALVEVGERWARGELSVAAEHFLSNLVRRRLLALLASQPAITPRMTAVLGCLPGHQHELGLLMLAVFLRWAGARIIYLGADMPVRDLLQFLEGRKVDALCLSTGPEADPHALDVLMDALVSTDDAPGVYLGGAGAGERPHSPAVRVLTDDLRTAATEIVEGHLS